MPPAHNTGGNSSEGLVAETFHLQRLKAFDLKEERPKTTAQSFCCVAYKLYICFFVDVSFEKNGFLLTSLFLSVVQMWVECFM